MKRVRKGDRKHAAQKALFFVYFWSYMKPSRKLLALGEVLIVTHTTADLNRYL